MGENLRLQAEDGHELDAFRALPSGAARGGIVLVQEIFGVNHHIRGVAERFAAEGYAVIAPALFDRIERGVELAYTDEGTKRGRELRTTLGWEAPLRDLAAAAAALREHGRVAVLGFCWGGSLAWLSACRLDGLACAVGYYGAQIIQFVQDHPRVPVLLHFGARDPLIPADDVVRIRASHPDVAVEVHAAGHGFNCDERADFDAVAAESARARTLDFLSNHINTAV